MLKQLKKQNRYDELERDMRLLMNAQSSKDLVKTKMNAHLSEILQDIEKVEISDLKPKSDGKGRRSSRRKC